MIRLAGRGALLAGAVFVPVAGVAAWLAGIRADLATVGIVVGAAGVALLGAGLAPAVVGSRIDAVVVGVAFALGAPVAAVISMLIAAIPLSALASGETDLAGFVLSGGVLLAIRVAPLVAGASAMWVIGVRRLGRIRPEDGAPS